MLFIETPIFTRQAADILRDDDLQTLQSVLLDHPTAGVSLGGGLFKIRWGVAGRGKRGGIRVIYLYRRGDVVILAYLFPKNVQDDLTPSQLKQLRDVLADEPSPPNELPIMVTMIGQR